jgi:hypothetical protein
MFRTLSTFVVIVLCCVTGLAQTPVRITDPNAILRNIDPATDKHVTASVQAAGLSDDLIGRIAKALPVAKWPQTLRMDSALKADPSGLVHMITYHLCDLELSGVKVSLLHIPAAENVHMPEHMRSKEDLFMVVKQEGIGAPPMAERPKASKGPNWKAMPAAKITQPEFVYATYDLATDPLALHTLEARGLSPAEIDAVIFRSHERNWPEGIDAFEKRRTKLKLFKKYKAHIAAKWENKVLLVIPAEINKDLPAGLRPYMDIYMVYTDPAVAAVKK